MNIDLKIYSPRRKPYYAAMILLAGITTTMWAAKVSPMLSVAIEAYWFFLLTKTVANKTVAISETQVTISSLIGSLQLNKKLSLYLIFMALEIEFIGGTTSTAKLS